MGLVLIVDDDADNRETLAEVLSDDGYLVEAAASAADALARIEGGLRPDLVLLDLMMPGMSGEELIEHIRRGGLVEDVPLVVLSARTDWSPPPGVQALRKPAGLQEVLATVRASVSRSSRA
jgi:CheY-like chemotaxis protein